jgi:hypothetical protein
MGYYTKFKGCFNLNKELDKKTHEFLIKFNKTKRVKRKLPEKYGVDGEFYVDGKGFLGQEKDETVIDINIPPSTQPGLWCDWKPSEDGKKIEWDGRENFYNHIEWLEYLIDKVLEPKGYKITGKVEWIGENLKDRGVIEVIENKINSGDYENQFWRGKRGYRRI